ncbi:rho GTPase-activating protein 17-like [Myxocyprinus asiaticus]|uniref:rho GTPase-activating protein 17-like n=1 Tax=Myxocyprinus asiaticus TaxID=70543 RepID=UPI0022222B2B|nr:rho GTPase-activating protein 17-like [Myxocyprinus asiaticus]
MTYIPPSSPGGVPCALTTGGSSPPSSTWEETGGEEQRQQNKIGEGKANKERQREREEREKKKLTGSLMRRCMVLDHSTTLSGGRQLLLPGRTGVRPPTPSGQNAPPRSRHPVGTLLRPWQWPYHSRRTAVFSRPLRIPGGRQGTPPPPAAAPSLQVVGESRPHSHHGRRPFPASGWSGYSVPHRMAVALPWVDSSVEDSAMGIPPPSRVSAPV